MGDSKMVSIDVKLEIILAMGFRMAIISLTSGAI